MTPAIEAVAVVVPAHDEEELLPAALRALRASAQLVAARGGPPVDLLVVADACHDRTVSVAVTAGVRVLPVDLRSVEEPARRGSPMRCSGCATWHPAGSGWPPPTPTRSCHRAG